MLMVVFGAGASFDSIDLSTADPSHVDLAFRPPLANELFADRPPLQGRYLDSFPEIAAIANEARLAAGTRDVEDILAEYQSRANDERVARQLVRLRFYLRNVLSTSAHEWHRGHHGTTNYAGLIEMIERSHPEQVLLVTFNYDDLLERAIENVLRYNFSSIDSYVQDRYKMIRLHGCVRWGRVLTARVDTRVDPQRNILQKPALETLSEVTDQYAVTGSSSGDGQGNLVLPAIAVPLRRKDSFECPNSHVDLLRDALPKVDRVITIGWRGAEEQFLSELVAGLQPGTPFDIVSSEHGHHQTYANLLSAGLLKPEFRYLNTGFSGFMRMAARIGAVPKHDALSDFGAAPGTLRQSTIIIETARVEKRPANGSSA